MIEFQDGTLTTMEVMGCQVHAIRKALRLLFADPVPYGEVKEMYSFPLLHADILY